MARGSDRPELGSLELARLFLAAVCDTGLAEAPANVTRFSQLRTEGGINLLDILEGVFSGRVPATSIRSLIFQLEPAGAVLISSAHLKFGSSISTDGAARHVVISGTALAGIVHEFMGETPEQADHAIAVSRLSAALI